MEARRQGESENVLLLWERAETLINLGFFTSEMLIKEQGIARPGFLGSETFQSRKEARGMK